MELLVKKAKRGDAEAFITLIEENKQSMYKVARGFLRDQEDVADAMAETVLNCFEKIGSLKQDSYFKTWMIRILINKCNEIARKTPRTESLEQVPEPSIENTESHLIFQEMLLQLNEKNRLVMALYYGEDYSIHEIAQILEISENAVKQRLVRGRKEILKAYENA